MVYFVFFFLVLYFFCVLEDRSVRPDYSRGLLVASTTTVDGGRWTVDPAKLGRLVWPKLGPSWVHVGS